MSQEYFEHYEAVDNHLNSFFSNDEMVVFHEIMSLGPRLHVYLISPTDEEHKILLTSGMSSRSMNSDDEELRFAELMLLIPKDVNFGDVYPSKSKHDWMISSLKEVAKIPHDNGTVIKIGDTTQHDENFEPYSEHTNFCGALIIPSFCYDKSFTEIPTPNGIINIYSFFPLYREELEYKFQNGYRNLMQLLVDNDCNEVLELNRINVCK